MLYFSVEVGQFDDADEGVSHQEQDEGVDMNEEQLAAVDMNHEQVEGVDMNEEQLAAVDLNHEQVEEVDMNHEQVDEVDVVEVEMMDAKDWIGLDWSGVARQYCPTEHAWCPVVEDHHGVFGFASHAVGVARRAED